MVATVNTITLNPGYTAANFATAIRQSFIDAGLMTEWFDSDLASGIEHRILEITYNAAKTYGKTYYWFQFTGANMFAHIATGWNATTKLPTGSNYLDYIGLKTATTNHLRFANLNNSQVVTITRITSGERANFSVFFIRNGSTSFNFCIDPTAPRADVVDLDKVCYSSMMFARVRTSGFTGLANWQLFPMTLRRNFLGTWLREQTTVSEYGANNTASAPWEVGRDAGNRLPGTTYGWPGNASNDNLNASFNAHVSMMAPVGHSANNTSYSSDYRPAWSGMRFNVYSDATLPTDFILLGVYNTITLEILTYAEFFTGETYLVFALANGTTLNDSVTMVAAARTS
jgi:hypothetical protein